MYIFDEVLLNAATVLDTTSDWIPCAEFAGTLTFVTSGIVAGDEVTLQGSNDAGVSSAITNVETVGSVIAADGVVAPTVYPKWIRAKLTAVAGGGSVTVKASGRSHR